jgi:hypothetical protein
MVTRRQGDRILERTRGLQGRNGACRHGQPTPDVFVMRADGTDVRRLTDDAVEEGTVTFAPKR